MDIVLILLSTYNGEKYLREQIESLIAQEDIYIKILVRDDGSNDDTLLILQEYKDKGVLDFYTGGNLKPARSFMELIFKAPEADYYALCDQDDVWDKHKVSVAVKKLKCQIKPALYYCAMNIVDQNLNKYGYYFREESKSKSLEYSCLFGDEIAGCTMVLNKKLMKAIRIYNPGFITMHDGWIHRICLCVNGEVIGDSNAYIQYRQHGRNTVGMNKRSLSQQYEKWRRKEKKLSKLANEMRIGYGKCSKDLYEKLCVISQADKMTNKFKIVSMGIKCNSSRKEIAKLILKLIRGSF